MIRQFGSKVSSKVKTLHDAWEALVDPERYGWGGPPPGVKMRPVRTAPLRAAAEEIQKAQAHQGLDSAILDTGQPAASEALTGQLLEAATKDGPGPYVYVPEAAYKELQGIFKGSGTAEKAGQVVGQLFKGAGHHGRRNRSMTSEKDSATVPQSRPPASRYPYPGSRLGSPLTVDKGSPRVENAKSVSRIADIVAVTFRIRPVQNFSEFADHVRGLLDRVEGADLVVFPESFTLELLTTQPGWESAPLSDISRLVHFTDDYLNSSSTRHGFATSTSLAAPTSTISMEIRGTPLFSSAPRGSSIVTRRPTSSRSSVSGGRRRATS